MKSIKSPVLTSAFLMASALTLSACASGGVIPDSLRAPCESTVDVREAKTVGDLGKAIIQGDGDLRVCDVRREAIVAIADSRRASWFDRLWPG
ncbi:hypothetical protein [Brevundimonas sp.]